MKKLLLGTKYLGRSLAGVLCTPVCFVLVLSFVLSGISHAVQNENSEIKERLNRIFYWQIADELKLSAKTEKALSALVEEMQKRRNEALDERQKCIDELKLIEKKITALSAEPILKRYQQALTNLAKVDSEEHERLQALLGAQDLARFYLVRESVAQKIREALKHTESSGNPSASSKK